MAWVRYGREVSDVRSVQSTSRRRPSGHVVKIWILTSARRKHRPRQHLAKNVEEYTVTGWYSPPRHTKDKLRLEQGRRKQVRPKKWAKVRGRLTPAFCILQRQTAGCRSPTSSEAKRRDASPMATGADWHSAGTEKMFGRRNPATL